MAGDDVPPTADLEAGAALADVEIRTHAAVADVFGVARRQVSRWKKAGCPGLDRAPYDCHAVRAWLQQREGGRVVGAPSKTVERLLGGDVLRGRTGDDLPEIETLRKIKLAAEIEKIGFDSRIRKVQGDIISARHYPKTVVEEMFADRVNAVRSGHDLIPDSCAVDIVTLDWPPTKEAVAAIIRRELDDLHRAFASPDFMDLLEQKRRSYEANARVGAGTGRTKKGET